MFMSYVHQTLEYQKFESWNSNKYWSRVRNDENSSWACGSFRTLIERPRIQSLSTPIPPWPWWHKFQVNGLNFQTAKVSRIHGCWTVTWIEESSWSVNMMAWDENLSIWTCLLQATLIKIKMHLYINWGVNCRFASLGFRTVGKQINVIMHFFVKGHHGLLKQTRFVLQRWKCHCTWMVDHPWKPLELQCMMYNRRGLPILTI